MKLGWLVTGTTAFALTLLVADAEAATKKYSGELTPGKEVDAPTLNGANPSGEIEVVFDDVTKRLCGLFRWRELTGPPTQLHIHLGPAGVNGPDKIALPIAPGLTKTSDQNGYAFNIKLSDIYATALASQGLYGNIHTATNAKGEIRDQLYAFDGFPTPVCGPETVIVGDGGAPTGDGGGMGDGGGDGTSSSSSSSSSGSTDTEPPPADDPPSATGKPKPDAGAAAKDEGGCSTTTSSVSDFSWVIAVTAAGAFIVRARRRRQTKAQSQSTRTSS